MHAAVRRNPLVGVFVVLLSPVRNQYIFFFYKPAALEKKPVAASACLRRGTSAKSRRHSLRAPVCGRGRPPRRSKRAEGAGTPRSAAERARRAAQPRPQQAWAGWEGGVRKRGVSGGRKREGKTLRRGSGAAQTAAAARGRG